MTLLTEIEVAISIIVNNANNHFELFPNLQRSQLERNISPIMQIKQGDQYIVNIS